MLCKSPNSLHLVQMKNEHVSLSESYLHLSPQTTHTQTHTHTAMNISIQLSLSDQYRQLSSSIDFSEVWLTRVIKYFSSYET